MLAAGCTGLDALNPICQVGSLGGSVAASGFESVLSGISQWVASGAEWLLGQIGDVLVSTTTVDVGATWFRTHYGQMTALAGVVILPMLLVSTLQAIVRQNPGQLVRTYLVQLPLALLLAVVAIQVVILGLSATDAMSDAIAGGTGADVTSLLSGVTTGLVAAAADPTIASFVLLLIALLVAVAAFVLWLELLIRAAAVYVAVLFLPLALAALVWPAVSHWCRRLVETLAALILSKFVIVATLSLAAGAVSSGTAGSGAHGAGFSAVLAGGALLVMATFVPFAILRMIPVVEAGAVGHLDGLRARGTAAMTRVPRTAASHALHGGLEALGDARLMQQAGGAGAGAGSGAGWPGPRRRPPWSQAHWACRAHRRPKALWDREVPTMTGPYTWARGTRSRSRSSTPPSLGAPCLVRRVPSRSWAQPPAPKPAPKRALIRQPAPWPIASARGAASPTDPHVRVRPRRRTRGSGRACHPVAA